MQGGGVSHIHPSQTLFSPLQLQLVFEPQSILAMTVADSFYSEQIHRGVEYCQVASNCVILTDCICSKSTGQRELPLKSELSYVFFSFVDTFNVGVSFSVLFRLMPAVFFCDWLWQLTLKFSLIVFKFFSCRLRLNWFLPFFFLLKAFKLLKAFFFEFISNILTTKNKVEFRVVIQVFQSLSSLTVS